MSYIYENITLDLDKITDEYMRRIAAATDELMDEKLASIGYVKVVRCRDCKHGHEVIWPAPFGIPADYLDCSGALVETWDYYNDEEKLNPVEPDGFCKWGERK